MQIYLIIYGFILLSTLLDNRYVSLSGKKIVLIFWCFVLTFFRGLRWDTGTDWDQFLTVFLEADWDNIFNYVRYGEEVLEFGYVFLNVLIRTLGGDYTVFLLLTNAFVLISYYYFSTKFPERPIFVFVIILFSTSFFPVRQNLAAAIILLSYFHIIDRRFIWFLVTVLVATTIHTSAIIFFPFYFLLRVKLPPVVAIFSFIVVATAGDVTIQRKIMTFVVDHFSFLGDMIILRILTYMEITKENQDFRNFVLTYSLILFFLCIFSFYKNTSYRDSKRFNFCFNVYLSYLLITEFFRDSMQEMIRVGNYLSFGFAPLLAITVTQGRSAEKLIKYPVFFLYLCYKFYITINHHYPDLHVPYHSIFEGLINHR